MSEKKVTRGTRFVAWVLKRRSEDKGFGARLRRADNPSTAYQSWGELANFGVQLEKQWEYLPFALIGAAVARLKDDETDGTAGLGQALRSCFKEEKGDADKKDDLRLRRLLACDSIEELVAVLRPMLSLIRSKAERPLCLATLLDELLKFTGHEEQYKRRWAQQYYSRSAEHSDSSAE